MYVEHRPLSTWWNHTIRIYIFSGIMVQPAHCRPPTHSQVTVGQEGRTCEAQKYAYGIQAAYTFETICYCADNSRYEMKRDFTKF